MKYNIGDEVLLDFTLESNKEYEGTVVTICDINKNKIFIEPKSITFKESDIIGKVVSPQNVTSHEDIVRVKNRLYRLGHDICNKCVLKNIECPMKNRIYSCTREGNLGKISYSYKTYLTDYVKMENKEVKITAPEGYEIDEKNSTFQCIKFKKKVKVRTWEDFSKLKIPINGSIISEDSCIRSIKSIRKNIFATYQQAKSALAMAQISQLMLFYGGYITDDEWGSSGVMKYGIIRDNNTIMLSNSYNLRYSFLAFHTDKQREDFLIYNRDLVMDYLMLNNDPI